MSVAEGREVIEIYIENIHPVISELLHSDADALQIVSVDRVRISTAQTILKF